MSRLMGLFLCFAALAAAQESRGTIAGIVSDAQGAGIPGAKVTIANTATGVENALTTNDRGAYVAPLLIPGSYRISAGHEGFKKFSRDGIALSVNDNLRIDITLELGAVTETVTVTDSAPIIEASSGNMGVVIGGKEVAELPLAHGTPYVLIGLAPGATFEGDATLNRPYEPGHIAAYSMGGSAPGTTDITMDGVVNTYRGSAVPVGVAYSPPADAIGEMRVETSSFDARAGQTSGGVINISLKSGTNKLRGSFTFTKMRPEWMANTWFGNRSNTPRGDFDYNRWSASANGPIYIPKVYNGKNKTFFMWSYEALSDQRPRGGTLLTVPTNLQRKGDFSDLIALGANYQIYNPFTRRRETGSTTRYRIDPFPGNIVPASLFNPVSLKAMEYFPAPLDQGTTADHRYNFPKPNSPEVADYFTHIVRVDHNFGSSNRMFVRGNGYVRDTHRNDYFETRATGIREKYRPVGFAIDDVHTLSPTVVLNVRYGYTRVNFETTPFYGRNFDLSSLGFPKSFTNLISPDVSEFPSFEINGYFNSIRTGSARYMDTHSLVVAATRLRGSHTLDFGFEARSYRQNQINGDGSRSGRFIFDTTWTRGPLDNSTASPLGQGWASYLMGLLSTSANGYVSRPSNYSEASTVWCGYLQDNWRVRRNLTLNLGVRYELEGPLTERYNRSIRDFNSAAALPIEAAAKAAYAASWSANPTAELPPDQFKVRGGLVFAGINGQPRELWARDINNIAPRFSLAWSLAKGTVVRAGYGIFFGALGMRRTDVVQNGFTRNTQVTPTKDSGLTFYATLSNPFPDGILEPVGADLGAMTDVGNSISYFDPSPKASYNQRWQASVQRQLKGNSMIEVAYVGNRSTKLQITRDMNIVGNQFLSRSPYYDVARVNYLSANIPNPFRGLAGVNGTMGTNNNITRESLLKPYPQFTAVNTSTYQGYSWYHSLQVRGAHRLSRGLSLNGSFTWARTMNATSFLNPADDTPYESLSSVDRPYRISGSVLYQVPVGRKGAMLRTIPKWLDAAVGGWQLSAILMYQSGQPLVWQDVIFLGNPEDIAKGPQTVDRWFNVDAGFTRASTTRPSYHYRTWPFYFSNLRRDASNNIDLSISKRWRLQERGTEFHLRGEALNAFNHPLFGGPQMDQFNSAFGQVTTTANYPRQIQAVFRLVF